MACKSVLNALMMFDRMPGVGLSIIDYNTEGTSLFIRNGGLITLVDSQFRRITTSDKHLASSVIAVAAVSPKDLSSQQLPTVLRLQSTTISDSNAAIELSRIEGAIWTLFETRIYSDVDREVDNLMYTAANVNTEKVTGRQRSEEPLWVRELALPLEPQHDDRPGIDASSPWFLKVQQVRP